MQKPRKFTDPHPQCNRPKREPADIAKAALSRFRKAGERASEVPTPERLLRAGGTARVEAFALAEPTDDPAQARSVQAFRLRIEDGPLARLRARGHLAADATRNVTLAAAGERYRMHWYNARLSPLKAMDISRERVSGERTELLRSERQLAHLQAFEAASRAIRADVRRVVQEVGLQEREPVDVGREVSGYTQDKVATAVALYLLRQGLAILAVHFGLMTESEET